MMPISKYKVVSMRYIMMNAEGLVLENIKKQPASYTFICTGKGNLILHDPGQLEKNCPFLKNRLGIE